MLHYYRSLILILAYRQTGINVNYLVLLTFRHIATSPWCLHLAVGSAPSLDLTELLDGEPTLKFARLSETTKAVWYWPGLRGLPLHHIQVAG